MTLIYSILRRLIAIFFPVRKKFMRMLLLIILSLLIFPLNAHAGRHHKHSSSSVSQNVMDQLAHELYSKSFDGAYCNDHPSVALGLWTISSEKSPLDEAATKRIYEELLSSLLKTRPKCINIIDSAAIGLIADHLNKSGALEESGGNILAALTSVHQNVDMLIFPELYSQAGNVIISLRIVEQKSAKTLYSTKPIALPSAYTSEAKLDEALSLDKAIKLAADRLLQGAPELSEIQTDGIFYEGTGAQPEAGRFISDRLIAALTSQTSNSISGKALKVRGISIEPKNQDMVSAKELDSDAVARTNNIYTLTGRYWVRDKIIELQTSLKRPDGGLISWSGPVKVADLKGMDIHPQNKASLDNPLPKSALAFQITTPQGLSPTYRVGDELQLMIRSNKTAWVYCFYVDSKGEVEAIFPPPDRLADGRTAQISPNHLVKIPDPQKDRYHFRFSSGTTGEELVSCFAADREIKSDLPAKLFPEQTATIPFVTLQNVRELFKNIPHAHVTEGLVTVTVTP